MIQNLIGTLVNVADTVMLGYVSQTAMSASSLANQYTFILFCLYYGMATGTSVLCAQYWGKGDKKTVEKILGLAERISLIVSLVFFVISFSMPTTIMKIFTNSPDTIAAGSEYLKVISFSFMFMGFSQVFMSALRSVGKIMLPSVTYIVSLCVNVFCNATFIFGLFGLPKLGVTGVALGTVIARIAEVLICLIYSLNSSDVRFRIKYFCAKSGILFRDFMKIASPAVINDVVWSFASSAFAAILGHIGDDMVAANAVAVMVVNIGAIACRGFANATTIIISQELGKDHKDTAREYGKRMLRITIIVSLIGCAIILAVRPMILDFYRDKLTETAIYYLGIFIIMTTWRLVGEGINTCLICGCFRGGGDSRFGMIVDSIFMWLVAVPLTFLAAYVFKLPPIWVYFIMTLDEFEKMPAVFIHYFRGKWLTNITRDFESGTPLSRHGGAVSPPAPDGTRKRHPAAPRSTPAQRDGAPAYTSRHGFPRCAPSTAAPCPSSPRNTTWHRRIGAGRHTTWLSFMRSPMQRPHSAEKHGSFRLFRTRPARMPQTRGIPHSPQKKGSGHAFFRILSVLGEGTHRTDSRDAEQDSEYGGHREQHAIPVVPCNGQRRKLRNGTGQQQLRPIGDEPLHDA